MNNILFVSVFKNIGRDNWHAYFQRSQKHYINSFLKLSEIKYNMIVFVEKEMYESLQKYNLPSNIQLIVDDFEYFNELLPQFQKVMESEEYKKLIPEDRKLYCEHSIPAYNVIMNTKFYYMKKAKEMVENYEYYCWIDFGYIKNDHIQVPKNINFSKLKKDKILYLNHYKIDGIDEINKLNKRISPQVLLSYYHVYLCGNVFIVPNNLVCDFFKKVENKTYELLKIGVCDDDQNLILQLYYDYPDMFDLVYDGSRNWYYIFENYLKSEPNLPLVLLSRKEKESESGSESKINNLLTKTLKKYNWQYMYIDNIDNNDNNVNDNISTILSQMHENQIVILLNTSEIYCLRSSKAFKDAFESFGGKVMVGMEITGNCSFSFPNPIEEYWEKQKKINSIKSLNSINSLNSPLRKYPTNIIAGYAKDLLRIFNSSNSSNSSNLNNFINEFPEEVHLDVNADIFHISNFGLNSGVLNIHIQKNDSPTFAEFFGRGAFFLILPHTHLSGQKVISNFVQLMLENNASDETFRKDYNYPEPNWNESF